MGSWLNWQSAAFALRRLGVRLPSSPQMLKKILLGFIICLAVYSFSFCQLGLNIRSFIEINLIENIFFKKQTVSEKHDLSKLLKLAKSRELTTLKEENKILRRQLGAIPEKQDLYPAYVVLNRTKEYFLNFPYEIEEKLIGKTVIFENYFIGRVIRQSSRMLVVEKPFSAGFNGEGISAGRTLGKIKGEYNENLIFEIPFQDKVTVGEDVYLLEKDNGARYLLGKIIKVTSLERQSIKKAEIDYLPKKINLKIVFLVK